jgi:ABC-2 type transport system permease protein
MALALPVMIMLLFVYLFGGAIDVGTAYVTYVVPGVLLLCVGFGAAGTALTVSRDLHGGVIDRFRSLDVGPGALLTGHVTASLARNAVATTLVVLVVLLIEFRPHADVGGWLAAVAVLGLFVAALSWLAAAFGVATRSPDAAAGFSFFLSFLAYPSSAFVRVETMPHWLQGFARHQPVTQVVEAVRALLLGHGAGSAAVRAVAWSVAIITVCVGVSALLYRRRAR